MRCKSLSIALLTCWMSLGTGISLAEQPVRSTVSSPEQLFSESAGPIWQPVGTEASTASPCFDGGCLPDECCPSSPSTSGHNVFNLFDCCGEDSWLESDETLLHDFQKQKHGENWTYSIGGALRWRYIDEANRLRPPLAAGRSSYDQWRFSLSFEASYKDWVTAYFQLFDASTFGNDLPIAPIDENRWDPLQMYVDLKALDLDCGDIRYRYGRQTLLYGIQHLVSPLGWGNTFRNFEGHRAYFSGENWNVDAIAVQALNGASRGVVYRVNSFDAPNQDQWLGGIYATYKKFGSGTLDLYWLWSDVHNPAVNVINGNRHTIGSRWAGKKPLGSGNGGPIYTWSWDLDAAYQFGTEDYLPGPEQDLQAGFASAIGNLTFEDMPWTPTLTGLFWWGSGDDDPTDGTSHTVSTLYPLGHAYWGMIDNFSGSNLLDYSVQLSVKPAKKLTFLTAWHWFDKAASQDAIYNAGGVPFGGVTASPYNLGNELDLVATYQVNKNLQLQLGYFWFWYGDAIDANPNALVAARNDAEQIYFYVDWLF